MLMLGAVKQQVKWEEAGISLDLVPLEQDMDARLIEETITEVRDDAGKLMRIKRDSVAYAEGVGIACIKSWSGVVDDSGNPVPCTVENVRRFMRIEVAQNFVFKKVKSLEMYRRDEVDAAKKD